MAKVSVLAEDKVYTSILEAPNEEEEEEKKEEDGMFDGEEEV